MYRIALLAIPEKSGKRKKWSSMGKIGSNAGLDEKLGVRDSICQNWNQDRNGFLAPLTPS